MIYSWATKSFIFNQALRIFPLKKVTHSQSSSVPPVAVLTLLHNAVQISKDENLKKAIATPKAHIMDNLEVEQQKETFCTKYTCP